MRVTIIPSDRMVYVDGDAKKVQDHVAFPEGVHAIQWYDTWGEVEPVGHQEPNTRIESLEPYKHLLEAHSLAVARASLVTQIAVEEPGNFPTLEELIARIEDLEKKIAG